MTENNTDRFSSVETTFYPFTFSRPHSEEEVSGIETIRCPVCGETAKVRPFTHNRRETGICSSCGSWNRQRLLALLLMRVIERVSGSCPFHLSSPDMPDEIDIFSAESAGAAHKTLSRLQGYTWSRFAGSKYKSGDVVDGHLHQDLLATSFSDNQFDVVMTSDVLEHIPEPYLAHQEIYRILKPGGVHIFTVPSNMNNPLDHQRAAIEKGELILTAPPEWHGEANDSNLFYTVFGLEMICHLWNLGFSVRCHEISSPNEGILGPAAIGFEAVKHHEPLKSAIPTGLRNKTSAKTPWVPIDGKDELAKLEQQLINKDYFVEKQKIQLLDREAELLDLEASIKDILESTSWRITKPLRRVREMMLKFRRKRF